MPPHRVTPWSPGPQPNSWARRCWWRSWSAPASQATDLAKDVGLQLLANSTATVFGLGILILLLGPVSGAHFNPVVTPAEWWTARRGGAGVTPREVAVYVPAQVVGAIAGAILADAMVGEPLVKWSTHDRSAGHLLLGEVVATAGLLLLISSPDCRAPWAGRSPVC